VYAEPFLLTNYVLAYIMLHGEVALFEFICDCRE